jgi:uncharacterized phiE125 gp8 family phage protein
MSLELITPPAALPISVAEAKAQCNLDQSESDALIAGYIRSAIDCVEGHYGVRLITQTWGYELDAFPLMWPPGYIRLPLVPVQSIVEVRYTDVNGAEQTLDPAAYRLSGDRISLTPNSTWPATWRGVDAVSITFVVGFGDDWNAVPHDLRQAIMMLAAYWFAQREAASIGPDSGPVSDVPFSVKQILAPYRVWTV